MVSTWCKNITNSASTSSHLRWSGDELKCWKSWTNWRSGDCPLDPHFFNLKRLWSPGCNSHLRSWRHLVPRDLVESNDTEPHTDSIAAQLWSSSSQLMSHVSLINHFHGGDSEQMLSFGHKHVHNLPALVTTSPHACANETRAPPHTHVLPPRRAPPPAMTPGVKQCQPHTHTHTLIRVWCCPLSNIRCQTTLYFEFWLKNYHYLDIGKSDACQLHISGAWQRGSTLLNNWSRWGLVLKQPIWQLIWKDVTYTLFKAEIFTLAPTHPIWRECKSLTMCLG